MSNLTTLDDFLAQLAKRDGHQPEFLQAAKEVFTSLWPFIQANPKYASHGLLERLVEPRTYYPIPCFLGR